MTEQEAGEGVARGDKSPVECPRCGRRDETIRRAGAGDDDWMCGSCYAARGESEWTIEVCPRCEGSEFVEGVMTTDDPAVCAGCGYGVTPRKVTVIEKADRSGPLAALAVERDRLRAERDKLREAMSENPLPSPHEGERSDQCPYCGGPADRCGTCGSAPTEGEAARCDVVRLEKCGEVLEAVRDPAPTEPRSISEEQLERLIQLRDEWATAPARFRPDADALRALLAAYEQAEARADEWKVLAELRALRPRPKAASRESCDCLHCNMEEPVPESRSRLFDIDAWLREEARAERAEAERDTAQASEARLREDVTRAVSEFKSAAEACERAARQREDTEGPEPINTGKAAAYRITAGRLNRALASTPNPERCDTCGSDYKHGSTAVIPATAHCPDPWHHDLAPDPTPEPEEDHAVRHGARWLPPKENE